jgi:hypothetical protein
MRRKSGVFIFLFLLLIFNVSNIFASSCDSPPPSGSNPGGGNPDETFSVDSGFIREGFYFNSDPNAVTFQNGYFNELS